MSEHTAGPWYVHYRNHQIRTEAQTGAGRGRFQGECIAGVSTHCPEMIANALLIAAAPDLLAALRAAIEDEGPAAASEEELYEPDWLAGAREAVAKAIGHAKAGA